jgi:hypothetical protein
VSWAMNAAASAAAKVFPAASADSRGNNVVVSGNNNGVARQGQPEIHLTAVPFTQVGQESHSGWSYWAVRTIPLQGAYVHKYTSVAHVCQHTWLTC